MALTRLWVRNYRSLLDVGMEPGQLTVIIGENGSGKTNLYRALRLVSRGAEGRLATALLEEGGMPSILFAGGRPGRRNQPVRTVIGVDLGDISYEISLGLPATSDPTDPFVLDPEIKAEAIWIGGKRSRGSTIADRAGTSVILHDAEGVPVMYPTPWTPPSRCCPRSEIPDVSPKSSPSVVSSDDGASITISQPTKGRRPARRRSGYGRRSWPTTAMTWLRRSPPSSVSVTVTRSARRWTRPFPAPASTPR